MNKPIFKILISIFIIVFLIGSSTITGLNIQIKNPQTTKNRTIIVDDEGDGNVSTIQDAIDIALDGDIILVFSGTYVENITINKQISLIGQENELESGGDSGKPIIDGNYQNNIISIKADNVLVENFILKNSGQRLLSFDSCFKIFGDNITIFNNEIENVYIGVYQDIFVTGIQGTSNHSIIKNNFSNSIYGVWISDGESIDISGNNFDTVNYGICMSDNKNFTIKNNTFNSGGIEFYGNSIKELSSNVVENNTINGKPIRFYKNNDDVVVEKNISQIILVNCTNFVLNNLEFNDSSSQAIQFEYSSNNSICYSNISGNEMGIRLSHSNNNTIFGNDIIENSGGLFIDNSVGNIINNNLINGSKNGIYFIFSNSNIVYSNNFENNRINAFEDGSNDQWSYDGIGNFWDDHWYKKDNDFNGISEIPYYIRGGGIDNYPLMAPVGEAVDDIPPTMEIELPKNGYIHFGNIIDPYPSPLEKTQIIAFPWMNPFELKVRGSDNSGAPTILVFIDDYNIEEWWEADFFKLESIGAGSDLYKGKLDKWMFGDHTLTFVCFDKYALDIMYQMNVTMFYFPHPAIIP